MLKFDFSRFDIFSSDQFLLKRMANSNIEQQCVKVAKNVIDFVFRKWILIFRFPSEMKILLIDPVFSN